MGLFNYNVLHCIVFYDINRTVSPLDRPITAKFTKGFFLKTSCTALIKVICHIFVVRESCDPTSLHWD